MTAPAHALSTEWVDLATLRPHPDNANNGDVDEIAASLAANHQFRPIVVAADGTVLAGNHTYMAAMGLGWERIAVVRLDLDPGSTAALRVMAADNRTAQLGRYDDGLLADLLARIDADGGLAGTGYTADDLDALRHLAAAPDLADLERDTPGFAPEDTYIAVTVRLPVDLADAWSDYLADHGGAVAAIAAVVHA